MSRKRVLYVESLFGVYGIQPVVPCRGAGVKKNITGSKKRRESKSQHDKKSSRLDQRRRREADLENKGIRGRYAPGTPLSQHMRWTSSFPRAQRWSVLAVISSGGAVGAPRGTRLAGAFVSHRKCNRVFGQPGGKGQREIQQD